MTAPFRFAPTTPAGHAAQRRQSQLTKPPGSLGQLEDLAVWLADRLGEATPARLVPAIAVFAADHGVAVEDVSAFPMEVTGQMVANFVAGGAAISVLAAEHQATLRVIDVGVAHPVPVPPGAGAALVVRPIRAGSRNLLCEAAMRADECQVAWQAGAEVARQLVAQGHTLLIGGEMGIANTTAAAALLCALGDIAPEHAVGRGTGIDDARHAHKTDVVRRALARAQAAGTDTPHAWLAQLGGLEIAALAGFYEEAGRQRVPVLLDGFISTVAALVAVRHQPATAHWLLAAHASAEAGHRHALAVLGLSPLLDLGLRLGEASGAAIALPLLQAALALHRSMATFAEAGVANQ
ncbi:nicotinate-nucleotide--dimethylbenzimidazole phosphoribosyltransferase [Chitiniphilus eburneus]|uniref:Nicotinate-nucleotide--dimethylbenzimidazole phosphoribosyltransferase n=1 Tax=Chitiniphilus eburneus TaxID=2571148 RepID=A0A4V5MQ83_9NEIS|nr:nicotinate-nucleotide--dimethylbenzimidazole phosphoribosyltransferase [Chitiniphilus eburneus]TJZ68608.1 nicotinate-nucleotide--dimethylbenzimidazole phosphoribosyltransferase [Chitiniphilus eburneus]